MKRDERGALAVWTTVALLGFMVTLGLGVDYAGHARASQEARAVAAQAARAGSQEVSLLDGRTSLVPNAAINEAKKFATAAGYQATAEVRGPIIEVTTRGDYETMFLGVIGVWEIEVSGTGSADSRTVIVGNPLDE